MTKPRTILDVVRERRQAQPPDLTVTPVVPIVTVTEKLPQLVVPNKVVSPKPDPNAAQRLPDGSKFEVRYDAERVEWSGSLTVIAPGGGTFVFVASAPSVFGLLKRLDAKYRASLRAEEEVP